MMAPHSTQALPQGTEARHGLLAYLAVSIQLSRRVPHAVATTWTSVTNKRRYLMSDPKPITFGSNSGLPFLSCGNTGGHHRRASP